MRFNKKKIVICFPTTPFVQGGAEIQKEELIKQLRKKGHIVDEILLPLKTYPRRQILKDCIAWRMLDLTEVDEEKIDLVIAMKFPSYVIKHPNKVVWLLHQHRSAYDLEYTKYDDFETEEEKYIKKCIKKIDNKTLREAKKIFTISKNVSNRLLTSNGIKSEVLYPPIKNYEKYKPGEYGDYILSAGRFVPLKRIELIIEAMNYLKSNKIKLKITGKHDNDYGIYLKNLVKRYGLENRVEFLGFVSDKDLVELYSNCFAVYFAPQDEDYGYGTIEGFMACKPVITALDSGGPLEFVKDNVNGILFKREDTRELAKRIDEIYGKETVLKKMGENGFHVVKDITWDNVINKIV